MAQDYYWVVTCKNAKYHSDKNPLFGHRIPVGKTDAHSPRPAIPDTLEIKCDDPHCGKTYSYKAREVIRWYGDVPSFLPHPLFG